MVVQLVRGQIIVAECLFSLRSESDINPFSDVFRFLPSRLFLCPYSPLKSEVVMFVSFVIWVGLRVGVYVLWSVTSG